MSKEQSPIGKTATVQCGNCGVFFGFSKDADQHNPCPDFEVTRRILPISVTDTFVLREKIGMKVKDLHFLGSRKAKIEMIVGDDFYRKSEKWFKKIRKIDREHNNYFEEIADPNTGEVIHHCDEPLSNHWGHGSAKKNNA